jgi:hypothetical protein
MTNYLCNYYFRKPFAPDIPARRARHFLLTFCCRLDKK